MGMKETKTQLSYTLVYESCCDEGIARKKDRSHTTAALRLNASTALKWEKLVTSKSHRAIIRT